MSDRREFLKRMGGLALGASALQGQQGVSPPGELSGQGETGALRDPVSAGRPQERKGPRDNDEFVTAVEHRLQCTCGCTLDIYTCRTTDFSCTYSPDLHKEVLALQDQGKNADQIVAAFVAKYGEKILMAPKPEGFNIAGYLVPGISILSVGAVMFWILQRRSQLRAATVTPAKPAAAVGSDTPMAGVTATPDELERLKRELKELDQ